MKKLLIYSLLLVAFVTVSCKTESLQSYLVESQDKEGFITFDVPASVLQLSMEKASEEDKKAYESIKKINITGVPYKNLDEASYEAEKEKLKSIFKKSNYKELMKFKKDGAHAAIYYSGEADAIDEIVAFGYGKEMGVGVARVLGENMNPGKILEMMQKAKMNADNLDLKQFKMIFDEKHRSSEVTE
ncbi:DUF4252 domain-containing protein [Tenacibaculum caenipelagi]|uniref:Uncharacterized protein DUF4252 n=1 Tax=Tenacibaculum caenipelagi TaxID=1325435 RepID=A0A4R6TFR3_9FLAO|nr:DUF4252 domain-containing protein [Tenacibaculum caenipelagi]TDQ25478.1 uncharacterized protein DUF4252 [Tenacibaculum caenipelagi]